MQHHRRTTLSLMMGTMTACGGDAITSGLVDAATETPLLAVAPSMPFFVAPFAGQFPLLQFFDHNTPLQGIDTNGRLVTTWNESVLTSVPGSGGHTDGHSGYDFSMPIGTTLRSVAPGVVTAAFMTHPPVPCGIPGMPTVNDNSTIEIEHTVQPNVVVRTRYVHVRSIAVAVGDVVSSGQVIGQSGNNGCSGSPHLHFETVRKVTSLLPPFVSFRPIDPYGWTVAAADPWMTNAQGAESINLWRQGAAPARFKERTLPPNPNGSQAPVTITKVRWMGVNDAATPNNEFIELTLDTNFASSASLNGFQIRGDRANFTFNIPSGLSLTVSQPSIRIFTGSGTNTATSIFMGRTAPVWSNSFNDCARRVNTNENPPLVYLMSLGGTC
jgi:hypothetical protein